MARKPVGKKLGRFGVRQLAFEQLAARTVLSAGAYGTVFGPDLREMVTTVSDGGRDVRGPEIGSVWMGGMPGDMLATRGGFGGPGPSRDFGGGLDLFRNSYAAPIVTANVWTPPPVTTVWIVFVEMPSAGRGAQESHDAPPARSPNAGLPPGGVAPLASMAPPGNTTPAGNVTAQTYSSIAESPAAPPPAAPSLWFTSTTSSQNAEPLTGLSGNLSAPGTRSDQLPQAGNGAGRDLLVPDGSRSAEGGLIELDAEPRAEQGSESRALQRPGDEAIAALERLMGRFGQALKSANKVLAENQPARNVRNAMQVADRAQATQAAEGGLIELAVDRAMSVAVQPIPFSPSTLADTELSIEAGVALFQAFELGNVPGGDDGSPACVAPATDALPQGSAAAEEPSELLNERAALSAGVLLIALPLGFRKHAEETAKPARRLTRVRRWLDAFAGR